MLSAIVITNCLSFYPRIRNGPKFIVLQVWLIGLSFAFMFSRNLARAKFQMNYIAGVFEILYAFTNTVMYWFFAFKYWTLSLDFSTLDTMSISSSKVLSQNDLLESRFILNQSKRNLI